MRLFFSLCVLLGLSGQLVGQNFPKDIENQFEKRLQACVKITCFAQFELERQPVTTHGIVIDKEGHIVITESNIPAWLPPSELKDFKVFLLGDDDKSYTATYLGQDYLTAWHYIKVEEAALEHLVPITKFGSSSVQIGEAVWGMGALSKSFGYQPLFLSGNVSFLKKMPFDMGFSQDGLVAPGLPVFDRKGRLVGVGAQPLKLERMLFIGQEAYLAAVQRASGETERFLTAKPFLKYMDRIPEKTLGNAQPFLGVAGLQSLDSEAASLMGLKDQSAIVVSDVIAGTPAEAAGLKARDIIIEIDGKRFPKFRPNEIVSHYGEIQIAEHAPGERLELTVLRDGKKESLTCVLGQSPKLFKEAQREYFAKLGLTVREFLVQDSLNRRIITLEPQPGALVQFVRPNSPVSSAGLEANDWIREIDGEVIHTFEQAVDTLKAANVSEDKKDMVLLIRRGNETKVLQVKLD